MTENGIGGTEEVRARLEELRGLITASARKGYDVREAWRLFNEAEKNPERAWVFIERAFGDLSRKRRARKILGVALIASVVVLIGLAISLFVADRYGYEVIRHQMEISVALVAALVLFLMWLGFGRRVITKDSEFELSEEVPDKTEKLRRLIIENERKGVDVSRAWRLYEEARVKEKAPEEAAVLIERAFNDLLRKKYHKGVSATAFNYLAGLVFLAVFVWVAWPVFRGEASPLLLAIIWIVVIAVLYVLKGLVTSWIRLATARKRDLELPDDIPRDLRALAQLILRCERIGVHVKRAWRLYEEAWALKEKGKDVKSSVRAERAYSDLNRKLALHETSKVGLVVSIVALLVAIGSFYLMFKLSRDLANEEVLKVPLFIIGWGLIGSVAHVLYSGYRKIKWLGFEWTDLIGYFYRIVIGGAFAAVSFYVVQLGVTSLPGSAGEEVGIAMAWAGRASEFHDAFWEKEKTSADRKELRRFIDEFRILTPKNKPAALGALLIESVGRWEEYKIEYDGREIAVEDVKKAVTRYEKSVEEAAAARRGLTEAVWEFFGDLPETDRYKGDLFESLVARKETLDVANEISEEMASRKEEGIGIPVEVVSVAEDIDNKLGEYKPYYDEEVSAGNSIAALFDVVKKNALPRLEKEEKFKSETLKLQEKTLQKWSGYFKSLELSEKRNRLSERVDRLRREVDALDSRYWDLRETPAPGGEPDDRVAFYEEKLRAKKEELARAEESLAAVSKELQAALGRDFAPPIWQAPVFIVFAFLSGYSVEFVKGLFKRVEDMALPEERREARTGGIGGDEGEKRR